MALCCTQSDFVSDEELMSSMHTEIGAMVATFSSYLGAAKLYELSSYWSLPVIGCFYPYDGVEVGCNFVDALGIEMRRVLETWSTFTLQRKTRATHRPLRFFLLRQPWLLPFLGRIHFSVVQVRRFLRSGEGRRALQNRTPGHRVLRDRSNKLERLWR